MKLFNISKHGVKPVTAQLSDTGITKHYVIRHGISSGDNDQYELRLHPDHFKPHPFAPQVTLNGIYGLGNMYNDEGDDQIDVLTKVDESCTDSKVCIVLQSLTPPPGGYSTSLAIGKCSQIYCPVDNGTHPTIKTYAPVLYVYGPCELNWHIHSVSVDRVSIEHWKAVYNKSEWSVSKIGTPNYGKELDEYYASRKLPVN